MNKYLSFENLNEFWKYSMQASQARAKSSRNEDHRQLKWYGGATWEQAKELAISGWKEGLVEVEKYRAEITPFITDKILRPLQVYSPSGYNVDVGAYLSNDPECFISRNYDERNYPGKIFKIVSSISVSASIDAKVILQRGAMVCALVDAIEFAGHRVEVVCNDSTSASSYYRDGKNKSKGWFEVDVKVKSTEQPVDISSLAFCLAHAAMLRRIFFSVAEIEGWSDFAFNYGYPSPATDKGDIYIQEIFSGIVSNDQAIHWVLTELEKLGIDLEERGL